MVISLGHSPNLKQRVEKAGMIVGIPLIIFLAYTGIAIFRLSSLVDLGSCPGPQWANVSQSLIMFDNAFFNPFINDSVLLNQGSELCAQLQKQMIP
jgi:hypothetical protein